MSAVLTEFIGILTGGISTMAQAIGSGLSEAAKAAFVTTSEAGAITGLSTFGGILAVFAGISLCVGLTTMVTKWVMSLGARN